MIFNLILISNTEIHNFYIVEKESCVFNKLTFLSLAYYLEFRSTGLIKIIFITFRSAHSVLIQYSLSTHSVLT